MSKQLSIFSIAAANTAIARFLESRCGVEFVYKRRLSFRANSPHKEFFIKSDDIDRFLDELEAASENADHEAVAAKYAYKIRTWRVQYE